MKRVVVTGMGIVAPGGRGKQAFWRTLSTGTSMSNVASLAHIEHFRSQMVAAVPDWNPVNLTEQERMRGNRHKEFALVAALDAWEESGLDLSHIDGSRLAVAAGTAIGSTTQLEQEYVTVSRGFTTYTVDPTLASPYLYHATSPASLSAEIAAKFQATGPVLTVSTGCTAGIDAIAQAFEWLRDSDADIALAGASEAGICATNMASFDAIKATSPSNSEPKTASRPFDKTRNGFVLGEGCAFLVLETLEHAQHRGATILAELNGYGSALNAYHMTGLQRDGLDMAQAIRAALYEAEIAPSDVGYINAHGSSTPQNDRHETNAFKEVWGDDAHTVPISSIKSMIGHSLGAVGTLEIAACILALHHNLLPPTINYHTPDPECDLDYIPNTARACAVEVIVSTASGFGGFQSALVVSRFV